MSLFYRDISNEFEISFEEFIFDISCQDRYNKYCRNSNYYEIFKNIITSLILGEEIILLDEDFSDDEIIKLIGNEVSVSENEVIINKNLFSEIKSVDNLISIVLNASDSWKITLFTSGTTGQPKKVTHSFGSITRFVKTNHYQHQAIWGFAYNPTHMAGIQVFFQAFLNKNPIIRLFGLKQKQIFSEIEVIGISYISATPTFYRLLLPCNHVFNNVIRITSGGEAFDKKTFKEISLIFPNAKISNIYASTEAGSLFVANGDYFEVKAELKELIKIVDQELWLHKNLIGESDTLSFIDDCWYVTGDIIDLISDDPIIFRFISRKNELINIGGYKVNPGEIEEVLRQYPGILDVRIFQTKNSVLGNIICAEIVRESVNVDEISIRKYLQSKLQEYKIHRIFYFVNEIKVTRTGKISRN